ncbi:apolipoprotein N-acyltransferase [bacterium endosymbiont of Escarpia laminata]|nr:MAG: apolipoprotein N-acyltransferase [bacterium endosymbiont of Escarpia laminata]
MDSMKKNNIGLDILALLAGVVLVFAFAPFHLPWLALVSFAALFLIWSRSTPLRAAWRGFLFGLAFYSVGLHWLFSTLGGVDESFLPILTVVMAGVVLVNICLPGVCGYIHVSLSRQRSPLISVLLFASVWTLGEWVRTWWMSGFPHYMAGYGFIDTPLAGFAPYIGVLGLTFFVLLAGGLLALALAGPGKKMRLPASAALLSLFLSGTVLGHLEWTQPISQPLEVRLIHGNQDEERKFRRYKVIDTIERYLAMSQVEPRPDLVLWHESSVAYDLKGVYRFLDEQVESLRAAGTELLLGSYIERDGKSYNALFVGAEPKLRYLKRHLIPFGEFTPDIPLLSDMGDMPNVEMDSLTSGPPEQGLLEVKGVPLASSICFENHFGNELRHDWKDAQLLVHVSDVSWFEETWLPEQALQIARMRALESGKPMLHATNKGISAIIGPRGELVETRSGRESWFDGSIQPRRGQTPYAVWGEWPLLLLMFTLLLLALAAKIRIIRCTSFSTHRTSMPIASTVE